MPNQVVIWDDNYGDGRPHVPTRSCGRPVFLLICLLATTVVAYLFHTGRIHF